MQSARVLAGPAPQAAHPPQAAPVAAHRGQPGRQLFIDNVRWVMILLVLSMHAAVTYSPVGSWYYTEHPPIGPLGALFFLTYQGVLQGFFMSLLFFIAGCFVPGSYDAKGPAAFLAGRLNRLGAPTLLYVIAVGPPTEYFLARTWRGEGSFGQALAHYALSGRVLGATGPMWFCVALLLFCGAYAGFRRLSPRPSAPPGRTAAPGARAVMATIAGLTAATFLVRLAMPLGSAVLNLQLCYFPGYILMFALGVSAGRLGWMAAVTDRFAGRVAGACLGLAALIWPALLALGGALAGHQADYAGGLHWQSAALSLWESLVCVGMSFGIMALFRRRFAGQGRLSRFLSDNAFAVYVLHPPVLVGLAVWMAPVALPPVVKFAVLWALGAVVCFAIVAPLARRVPGLQRILQ